MILILLKILMFIYVNNFSYYHIIKLLAYESIIAENRLHFLKGLFRLCLPRSTMYIQLFLVQGKQLLIKLHFIVSHYFLFKNS